MELGRGCKDRSSAGLYKNDHNWQMHMLHHLGIVLCTLCCSIHTARYQSVNWTVCRSTTEGKPADSCELMQ